MEKRLPLALILCCLIIVGWSILNPPKSTETMQAEIDTSKGAVSALETPTPTSPPAANPLIAEDTERQLEVVFGRPGTRGNYLVTFTNRGGRLLSLRLGDIFIRGNLDEVAKEDPDNLIELLRPNSRGEDWQVASFGLVAGPSAKELFDEPLDEALWKMEEVFDQFGDLEGVRFTYGSAAGVVITKEFRPRVGERIIDFTLGLENVSAADAARPRQFRLTPVAGVGPSPDPWGGDEGSGSRMYVEPQAVIGWLEDDGEVGVAVEEMAAKPGADDLSGTFNVRGALAFAGVQNKFFACFLHPDSESQQTLVGASWRRVQNLEWAGSHPENPSESWRYMVTDIDLALYLGEIGEKRSWNYEVFAGPKAREELVEASPDYEAVTIEDLGFFSGIAQVILAILDKYYLLVGNWGWAIILLTLTVRLLLFPINRRSQTAMARFQTKTKRIQPKIDAIKEKYANNPQKLREEQGRIMQEEGAFPPLGGCLPMFLQIPVFVGLFQSLRVEYHLRQEPFLGWIQDLSQPDHLMRIDVSLPLIGTIEWLNILPLLMVILMVWQQRSMPKPTDEQQARMQKMMLFMPVMFAFFLYSYPAGLSLYMITSSGVGIFEIKVIKKFWPIDDTESAPKKGWMMRLAEKQAEQQSAMKKMQQQQHMARQKARKKRKR